MRRISADTLNAARYAVGHRVTRSTATVTFSQATPDQAPVTEATSLRKPMVTVHRLQSRSMDGGARRHALQYGNVGPSVPKARVQVPGVPWEGVGGGSGQHCHARSLSSFPLAPWAAMGSLALVTIDAATTECEGTVAVQDKSHSRDTSLPMHGGGALHAPGRYLGEGMDDDCNEEEGGGPRDPALWFWSGAGYNGHISAGPPRQGRACGTRLQKHARESLEALTFGEEEGPSARRARQDGRRRGGEEGVEEHHLMQGETFHTARGTLYLRRRINASSSSSSTPSEYEFPSLANPSTTSVLATPTIKNTTDIHDMEGLTPAQASVGATLPLPTISNPTDIHDMEGLEPAYFVSTGGMRFVFLDAVHLAPGGEDVDLEGMVLLGRLMKVVDTQVLHAVPLPAWARG